MRLTPSEVQAIKWQVAHHFGRGARVWVFGSRVEDNARGGDIDLLIEAELSGADAALDAELRFKVALKDEIGDQKIDVLLDYPARTSRPDILRIARETGVLL